MTKHYLVPRTRGRLWYMTCGSISPKYSLPSTCLSLQICGFFGIYSQSFFASKPFVSDLCIQWQQDAFLCILGDSRWKGKEDWGIDGSQLASLQPSNRLSEISPYLPASIVFLTLSFPFFICIPFSVWCLNSPVLFASLQSIKLRKGEKKGRVKRKNGTQSAVGLKDLREEKGEKTRETFLFISVPLLLSHLSALPHSPILRVLSCGPVVTQLSPYFAYFFDIVFIFPPSFPRMNCLRPQFAVRFQVLLFPPLCGVSTPIPNHKRLCYGIRV